MRIIAGEWRGRRLRGADHLRPTGDRVRESLFSMLGGHLHGRFVDLFAGVGTVGLERLGGIGLLRSLVVVPHSQGSGAGCRLVAALEQAAAASGMSELWLLTTDADAYFTKLGYEVMPRESTPESIRQTTEFSKLCPSDAIVMRKRV